MPAVNRRISGNNEFMQTSSWLKLQDAGNPEAVEHGDRELYKKVTVSPFPPAIEVSLCKAVFVHCPRNEIRYYPFYKVLSYTM
jgi:hypothetical protein